MCGGSASAPPDVLFPYDTRFPDPVVAVDRQLLDRLHPTIFSAPFASVLTADFFGRDLSALRFCETVYNRFRPFFFLTHPQVSASSPKKRRADVSFSFFRAVFYILEFVYEVRQEAAIAMFDTLAKQDVYLPHDMPHVLLQTPAALALEFSEIAKLEFEKCKHIPDVPQASLPRDLFATADGVFCQSALQAEQLIALAGGFVGVTDEFTYENGVDRRFYVACGTKFVVDTRRNPPQLIHNFRRSLSPNCVLKIVKCAGVAYAAIYAGVSDVNGIARRTRREKFSIQPNTELMLPIDFAPATIEEPTEFTNWHFDEIEIQQPEPLSSPPPTKVPRAPSPPKHSRPSREDRDVVAVIRQVDRVKKQKPKKEKESPKIKTMKRRPGKPPRSPKHVDIVESSLFSLIRSTTPEPYLFGLPAGEDDAFDDVEQNVDGRIDGDGCREIDCRFLDELFAVEPSGFVPLKVPDPVEQMMKLVDLSGFD
jgi:hypothetical protein